MLKHKTIKLNITLNFMVANIFATALGLTIFHNLKSDNLATYFIAVSTAAAFSLIFALLWQREILKPIENLKLYLTSLIDENSRKIKNITEPKVTFNELNEIKLLARNLHLKLKTANNNLAKAKSNHELEKKNLLSSINHEFRTPLNAIINFSDIQKNELMGPMQNKKYLEYAGDINKAGHYLLALVQNLIDISRVEDKYLNISNKIIDLNTAIFSVKDKLGSGIKKKEINLHINLDKSLPHINNDEEKFKQIIFYALIYLVEITNKQGNILLTASLQTISTEDYIIIHLENDNNETDSNNNKNINYIITNYGLVTGGLTRLYEIAKTGLTLATKLTHMLGGNLIIKNKSNKGNIIEIRVPVDNNTIPQKQEILEKEFA